MAKKGGKPGGGGGGGGGGLYPVELVFRDAPDDRIQSDGLGPYVDGVDGVGAQINGDRGRLQFFACLSSATDCPGPRSILFDFTDQASLPGPNSLGLPFDSGLVDSGFAINLIDINDEYLADGLLGMTEGEQLLARLKSNFRDQNDLLYTVRFRPGSELDSNWVLVTSLGGQISCSDSVPCASWTIETWQGVFTDRSDMCCPTNELDDIGTLISDNSNDEGDYHLPFSITITALPQSDGGGGDGGGDGGDSGGGNGNGNGKGKGKK